MVTVKQAHLREGQDNKSFVTLELEGDLVLIQSQNTGRFYATAKRCFISSTFDLKTAQEFIGKKMSGDIVRVQSDPYEFKVPESDEVLVLTHSYEYRPEEIAVQNEVLEVVDELD